MLADGGNCDNDVWHERPRKEKSLNLGEIGEWLAGEAAFEQSPVGFGRLRYRCGEGKGWGDEENFTW